MALVVVVPWRWWSWSLGGGGYGGGGAGACDRGRGRAVAVAVARSRGRAVAVVVAVTVARSRGRGGGGGGGLTWSVINKIHFWSSLSVELTPQQLPAGQMDTFFGSSIVNRHGYPKHLELNQRSADTAAHGDTTSYHRSVQ